MKITNEDNMKLMARYPDNYFDLAIVDPPYGIDLANMNMGAGKSKKASKIENRKWTPKDWDKNTPTKEYFDELFRISKNQIIWGGNYFELPPCYGYVIWDKEIPEGLSFSDCEMAWHSFKKAPKMFRYSAYLDKKSKFHPTQKPVKLYEWLLINYAQRKCNHKHSEQEREFCTDCRNQDVKILDTHLGSGSIAIACHRLGFDLTACELDKEYYDKAMKRLKEHTAQQRLF